MTIEDKIIKSVSDYLKRDATDKDLKQVNQVIPENNRRQSKIYFKGKLIAKI